MPEKCWMKREDHPLRNKQCCCLCEFLIPDFSHPWIDKKPITHRKGWICHIPLDRRGGYSGWPRHSIGCEMFTKLKRKKR